MLAHAIFNFAGDCMHGGNASFGRYAARHRLTKHPMRNIALLLLLSLLNGCTHSTPSQTTAQPNVHVLPMQMTIPGLDRQRTIRIYLPPDYDESDRKYPVLYMQDAQNLFDDATASSGEWGVDESLNALAKARKLELIVVGIDHGGDKRMQELSAWDNAEYGKSEGKQYASFIVDVLKPYIDQHYRTLADRRHTGIMGASMGGLMAHYAIYRYPQIFGRAGIFSPSYWYAPQVFEFTASAPLPTDAKLYFYVGRMECFCNNVPDVQRMVAQIEQSGFPKKNIAVEIKWWARHNEAAWGNAFPHAAAWLFAED